MSEYIRAFIKKQHFKQYWGDIKFKTHFGVCIYDTLKARGYNKSQNDDWDLFWSEKELIDSVYEQNRILPHHKINHFRTYYELCRKDNLSRNLKKYKKALEKQGKYNQAKQLNFFPMTFHLPLQYGLFLDEFKKNQGDKNIWIMKPVSKSQGKGIFLFNRINAISNWSQNTQAQQYIVQKYISDPLLIGGKKFDLRLYVLCLSYNPLKVYLNRSGFARFTHYRYDESKINNTQIHLTNVAIQKQTEQYNPQLGGKWFVDKLKLYLLSKYGSKDVNQCFYNIQSLIIKTLKSVVKLMGQDKHCFQLYGFDIMLDSALKPWIIQVNGSPSMRANTQNDYVLKCGIIDDVLTIVNIEGILTGEQQQVGGFDLIYKNDVQKVSGLGPNMSLLGCKNNRIENMKRLAKATQMRLMKQFQQGKRKNQNNSESNSTKLANQKKSFTVTKTTRQYSLAKPPAVKPNINNINSQNQSKIVQILKTNETESKSTSTTGITNKNWIIRKGNSFKKDQPSQAKIKQPQKLAKQSVKNNRNTQSINNIQQD